MFEAGDSWLTLFIGGDLISTVFPVWGGKMKDTDACYKCAHMPLQEYLGRRKTMPRKRISIFGSRAALPLCEEHTIPAPRISVVFGLQRSGQGNSLVK